MRLKLFVDSLTIEDITCGDPDIRKAFEIGNTYESELVVSARISDITILKSGKKFIKEIDEYEYEICGKIVGGFYTGFIVPESFNEKRKIINEAISEGYRPTGLRAISEYGEIALAVDCGFPLRVFVDIPLICEVYKESYSKLLIPLSEEEIKTREIEICRDYYIKIKSVISPVFLDFWEGRIRVPPVVYKVVGLKNIDDGGIMEIDIEEIKDVGYEYEYDWFYCRYPSKKISEKRRCFLVKYHVIDSM
jgi:hypothetical protein